MAAMATGVRTRVERARWYFDRGARALQEGEVARAEELFRRAIVHDQLYEEPYLALMRASNISRTAHRFSVVVTTWNRLEHLRRCLDSVRRNSFFENEIIVVDNNSQDGTIEYLRSQHDVRVIFNSTEITVTRASNLGFAAATGDFVGPLNDDNEVLPAWDLEIVRTLERERRVGAAVPLVIGPDGKLESTGHCHPFVSHAYTWVGRVERPDAPVAGTAWLADHPDFHVPGDCDNGAFLFMTRECYERVGGFDERFTHYFADPDLGYRVQHAGLRNLFCPTSVLVHSGLSPHMKGQESTRFAEGREMFAAKWLLAPKGAGQPIRSFIYFDRYLRHAGGEAPVDSTEEQATVGGDLAGWIPDQAHDIVVVGSGDSALVRELRDARKHAIAASNMTFLPVGFLGCDLVIAKHIVSRSCWPLITLMEFNRVLDAGGHVFLTVPPCDDLWMQHPEHHSVLTDRQWRRLFADAEFGIERVETLFAEDGSPSEHRYLLQKRRSIIEPPKLQLQA